MCAKPVIGIVAKPLSELECPDDIWTEDYVKDEFRDMATTGGCVAIGVLPPFHGARYNGDESAAVLRNNLSAEELADYEQVLGMCDGLVLQGGLSGDYYEYHAARYALSVNMPIIGICAGFNTLCRAVGCDITSAAALGLPPELHNVYSTSYRHEIRVRRGSELFGMFGVDSLAVNSLHTRFLDVRRAQENPEVLVNATVSDVSTSGEPVETVEAFTVPHARYAMGFKWHPELMEKEHQKGAFGPFLSACRG